MDFNFIDINSKQTDGVEEGEDDDERDQFNEGNAMAVDPLSMDNAALSTDNPEIKGEYEELILKCEPIDYDNEDQDDDREESRSHDGISLLPENDESRSNDGSAILPENDQSRSSILSSEGNCVEMMATENSLDVEKSADPKTCLVMGNQLCQVFSENSDDTAFRIIPRMFKETDEQKNLGESSRQKNLGKSSSSSGVNPTAAQSPKLLQSIDIEASGLVTPSKSPPVPTRSQNPENGTSPPENNAKGATNVVSSPAPGVPLSASSKLIKIKDNMYLVVSPVDASKSQEQQSQGISSNQFSGQPEGALNQSTTNNQGSPQTPGGTLNQLKTSDQGLALNQLIGQSQTSGEPLNQPSTQFSRLALNFGKSQAPVVTLNQSPTINQRVALTIGKPEQSGVILNQSLTNNQRVALTIEEPKTPEVILNQSLTNNQNVALTIEKPKTPDVILNQSPTNNQKIALILGKPLTPGNELAKTVVENSNNSAIKLLQTRGVSVSQISSNTQDSSPIQPSNNSNIAVSQPSGSISNQSLDNSIVGKMLTQSPPSTSFVFGNGNLVPSTSQNQSPTIDLTDEQLITTGDLPASQKSVNLATVNQIHSNPINNQLGLVCINGSQILLTNPMAQPGAGSLVFGHPSSSRLDESAARPTTVTNMFEYQNPGTVPGQNGIPCNLRLATINGKTVLYNVPSPMFQAQNPDLGSNRSVPRHPNILRKTRHLEKNLLGTDVNPLAVSQPTFTITYGNLLPASREGCNENVLLTVPSLSGRVVSKDDEKKTNSPVSNQSLSKLISYPILQSTADSSNKTNLNKPLDSNMKFSLLTINGSHYLVANPPPVINSPVGNQSPKLSTNFSSNTSILLAPTASSSPVGNHLPKLSTNLSSSTKNKSILLAPTVTSPPVGNQSPKLATNLSSSTENKIILLAPTVSSSPVGNQSPKLGTNLSPSSKNTSILLAPTVSSPPVGNQSLKLGANLSPSSKNTSNLLAPTESPIIRSPVRSQSPKSGTSSCTNSKTTVEIMEYCEHSKTYEYKIINASESSSDDDKSQKLGAGSKSKNKRLRSKSNNKSSRFKSRNTSLSSNSKYTSLLSKSKLTSSSSNSKNTRLSSDSNDALAPCQSNNSFKASPKSFPIMKSTQAQHGGTAVKNKVVGKPNKQKPSATVALKDSVNCTLAVETCVEDPEFILPTNAELMCLDQSKETRSLVEPVDKNPEFISPINSAFTCSDQSNENNCPPGEPIEGHPEFILPNNTTTFNCDQSNESDYENCPPVEPINPEFILPTDSILMCTDQSHDRSNFDQSQPVISSISYGPNVFKSLKVEDQMFLMASTTISDRADEVESSNNLNSDLKPPYKSVSDVELPDNLGSSNVKLLNKRGRKRLHGENSDSVKKLSRVSESKRSTSDAIDKNGVVEEGVIDEDSTAPEFDIEVNPLLMEPEVILGDNEPRRKKEKMKKKRVDSALVSDCAICNVRVNDLELHMMEKHQVVCKFCDVIVDSKKSLSTHLASHSMYVCQQCNRCYSSKASLDYHVRSHEVKPISCDYCSRTFKGSLYLEKHVVFHHKDVAREYVCDTCGDQFFLKESWKSHKSYRNRYKNHTRRRNCVRSGPKPASSGANVDTV
ncbi:mucin-4-like isoform X2 [Nilaparvata lugens]|uniref:mucin-4-like isoform X2 n=1 Tax=Nilaparvata lugens TaxID=108931 RepID=UPI00193DA40E|nr:mucin-4-like isoform X2 [Nilaparvata lugens]